MSNYYTNQANHANLTKMPTEQLYELLYSPYVTNQTKLIIISICESRIPHHTFYKNGKKCTMLCDSDDIRNRTLNNICWELEQADMPIEFPPKPSEPNNKLQHLNGVTL